MALELHTIEIPNGFAPPAQQDRQRIGTMYGVANAAGAAGATVQVAVTVPGSILPANGNYFVDYDLPADYTAFTTNKTAAGFTVNLQPRLAANNVAAGSFNLQVTF